MDTLKAGFEFEDISDVINVAFALCKANPRTDLECDTRGLLTLQVAKLLLTAGEAGLCCLAADGVDRWAKDSARVRASRWADAYLRWKVAGEPENTEGYWPMRMPSKSDDHPSVSSVTFHSVKAIGKDSSLKQLPDGIISISGSVDPETLEPVICFKAVSADGASEGYLTLGQANLLFAGLRLAINEADPPPKTKD